MWTRLRLRFAALVRRTRFERELADELAFHVQSRAEEWERRGLSPSAARRRARIELGSAERIKEEVRDVRLGRWLEVLRQDLHYGFRVLCAHPGITAIGVASLALGMAVCIYSFSRVHADYLAPLPGTRDPGSLVAVDARLSYPAFERIRELDGVIEGATAYLGACAVQRRRRRRARRRARYTPAQSAALLDELPDLLAVLPELRSAAVAERPPLAAAAAPGPMSGLRVSTSTDEGDGQRTFHSIELEHVGERYFETLGVPLVRGRTFTERDFTGGGAEDARERDTPVVINQTAEQRLFGAGTAVGRRLWADRDGRSHVVVGVVPDVRPSLRTADSMATAFVQIPAARFHSASIQGTTVLVRGTSDRGAMAAVRDELRRTDPRLTIFDARTMDEHLERFERSIRIAVSPLAGLSLFGLVLATIGLTGVTSYAVARRRSEIGIRMALGAERLHVLWLVLREGTFLVVAGAGLGAAGALAVARSLSALDPDLAQILGTFVGDHVLLVGAPVLLVAAAMLACAVPAWRAVRIDPASTLRAE